MAAARLARGARFGTEERLVAGVPTHVAVTEVIRRRLAFGIYAPGTRLPPERELAELLGVGRATVRTALRTLAAEGLVATSRGRFGGTVVLDDEGRASQARRVTRRFLRDVEDNFDFRLAVEPVAASRAAERASARERAAFLRLAAAKATSLRRFRALDSRFHLAIAEASRNEPLLEAIRESRAAFFRWADASWERVGWATLPAELRDFGLRHGPIAEALAAGDAALAEERMIEHLEAGRREFLDAVQQARRR